MKTYHCIRCGIQELNTAGEVLVQVLEDGKAPRALRPTRLAKEKSPTGFNYGYGGSGPSALAHSILADLYGTPIADDLYQDFKRRFIAPAPQHQDLIITEAQVGAWLASLERPADPIPSDRDGGGFAPKDES